MRNLTPLEIEERRLYLEKVLFTDSLQTALESVEKEEYSRIGAQVYHQIVLAMMELPTDVLMSLLDNPPDGIEVAWDTGARNALIQSLNALRQINEDNDITTSIKLETV